MSFFDPSMDLSKEGFPKRDTWLLGMMLEGYWGVWPDTCERVAGASPPPSVPSVVKNPSRGLVGASPQSLRVSVG